MMPTIENLEKEIEQFHINISNSNKLIETLLQVISATKNNTTEFSASTEKLKSELDKLSPELKTVFEQAILELINNVKIENHNSQAKITTILDEFANKEKEHVATIEKTVVALQEKWSLLPTEVQKSLEESTRLLLDEIKSDREKYITEMKNYLTSSNESILKSQDKYSQTLSTTTQDFITMTNTYMTQMENKYSSFIEKLESTNVDQIFKYSQEMNKSLGMKLNIAIGGVGVAIILAIISFFI